MNAVRRTLLFLAVAAVFQPTSARGQTDAEALDVANRTIRAMGGMDAWNDSRYLVWDIFGERHYWDKWEGDFRWEADSLLVLMNINDLSGKAWIHGSEVENLRRKNQILERAYSRWVNNSYWLTMPFKLLDPGVTLRYLGVDTAEAGQMSDVIELTFENVGLTPQNKYHVFVDRESDMICQWEYFDDRNDPAPSIVSPWNEWADYGGVMMSTGRGSERRAITNLSLPDDLPRSVFDDPGPVSR